MYLCEWRKIHGKKTASYWIIMMLSIYLPKTQFQYQIMNYDYENRKTKCNCPFSITNITTLAPAIRNTRPKSTNLELSKCWCTIESFSICYFWCTVYTTIYIYLYYICKKKLTRRENIAKYIWTAKAKCIALQSIQYSIQDMGK